MKQDVLYSVVIPVYNGEKSVQELADRICRLFEARDEEYEILFVDDSSSDNSWSKLSEMALVDKKIRAVRLSQNFGQHNATLCGMFYAAGRYVITMDDDLQHAPEDIPRLIQKMEETGAAVVIARLMGKKHQWYRRRASDLIRKFIEFLIKKPKGIYLSSFRLMESSVAEKMLQIYAPFPYIAALIFKATQNAANADIPHNARKYGNSNYTLGKMLMLASRLLVNCSPMLQGLLGEERPAYKVSEAANVNLGLAMHPEGGIGLGKKGLGSRGRTAPGSFNQKG